MNKKLDLYSNFAMTTFKDNGYFTQEVRYLATVELQ